MLAVLWVLVGARSLAAQTELMYEGFFRLSIAARNHLEIRQGAECAVLLKPGLTDLSSALNELGPCNIILLPGIYGSSKELNLNRQSLTVFDSLMALPNSFAEYYEALRSAVFYEGIDFLVGAAGYLIVVARALTGWHEGIKNKAIIRFPERSSLGNEFLVSVGEGSELHDVVFSIPADLIDLGSGVVSRDRNKNITRLGVVFEKEVPHGKDPSGKAEDKKSKEAGRQKKGEQARRLTRREAAERAEQGVMWVADGDGRKPDRSLSISEQLPADLVEREWILKILLELRNYLFVGNKKSLADFRLRIFKVVKYLQSSASENVGAFLHRRIIQELAQMLGFIATEADMSLPVEDFIDSHIGALQAFINKTDEEMYDAIGQFLAAIVVNYGPGRRYYRSLLDPTRLRANIPVSDIEKLQKIEEFLEDNHKDQELVRRAEGSAAGEAGSGLVRERQLSRRERASLVLQLMRRYISINRRHEVVLGQEAEGLIDLISGSMMPETLDALFEALSIPLSGSNAPDWLQSREDWKKRHGYYAYLRSMLIYSLTHGGNLHTFVRKLKRVLGDEVWAWLLKELEEQRGKLAERRPGDKEIPSESDGPIIMPTLECFDGTLSSVEAGSAVEEVNFAEYSWFSAMQQGGESISQLQLLMEFLQAYSPSLGSVDGKSLPI